MKVYCVGCGGEFEFQTKTITIEEVDIIFAECPKCEKRYISYVVDKEVKKQFLQTTKLLNRTKDLTLSFSQRQQAVKDHRELVKDNRRMMEQKKAQYQYLIQQVLDYEDRN